MSSWDLNGRTALITGAARGIGRASAIRLHEAGMNVALVGLEPEALTELADELGPRAIACEADVTDFGALQASVSETVGAFGSVDVAIANAGIHFIGTFATSPIEQLERELDVNLYGVLRTNRAVMPEILANKGYVLNIASLAAAAHAPMMASYSASKAGVEGLTNSLRIELAPTGARAGCAYFGIIDTDLARTSLAHESTKAAEKVMPWFVRRTVPIEKAIDAIFDGVSKRKSRVWAPRYVGGALLLRGVMQPLTEIRAMRSRSIVKAMDLAQPDTGSLGDQDPALGISGSASDHQRAGDS